MSEQHLIRSAAPTLAGLKTGSLFPFRYSSKQAAIAELRALNRRLTPKGLRLLPLRMGETSAMLYLYHPGRLQRDLRGKDAAKLLRQAGYRGTDAQSCLSELTHRLQQNAAFPHEIGLFLSYPPEDVRGFIEHRNDGCKCVGCWKVYGDETAAREKFAQFDRCTQECLRQHAGGCPLESLIVSQTEC